SPKYAPANQIACFAYPCPQPPQKIVGYTATQSITVKIRAVDTASDVRTGLAALGITDISGPDFSIDNQEAYQDQARAKAITDAQNKAEVLAKQLGVHLGKITSFSENGSQPYPVMYSAKAMDMASGATAAPAPVLPKGQNKITSNVSITYELR
ncbi:MAG TPA: SIMPL domain-containing protein, partial [Cyclobacteriaceae bacterium]|nr:SIMPL domain-containing protein [Cyclobacteriaceae bacterium]